jgi:hypothetical protein
MDYESDLVGPGKKYADIKALEESRVYADEHISNLEAEMARLRDDLDTRLSYEEFLTQIQSGTQTDRQTQHNQTAPPPPQTQTTAIQTPQDIERIVEQREQRKRLETNLETAISKYAEVMGPNHALKLKQQATELGMSEDQLKQMAAANPKAFFKLTGVEDVRKQDTFQAPPRTSVNSDALGTGNTQNKEAEKFREIYKRSPSEYWSPAVQNQLHKAVADGRIDPSEVL